MMSEESPVEKIMLTDKPRSVPILYSFRRCPYAMRARMGLYYGGHCVELREVDLAAIPQSLRALVPDSPRVPVLQLSDGRVLDESWDILLWAVSSHDPECWLGEGGADVQAAERWIEMNDFSFKSDLDHYKYAARYPEYPAEHYRSEGEVFLQDIETQLGITRFLLGERPSVADIGVFPFVRQFAHVDPAWFAQTPYPLLRAWLAGLLASPLFNAVMHKHPVWQPGQRPLIVGAAADT